MADEADNTAEKTYVIPLDTLDPKEFFTEVKDDEGNVIEVKPPTIVMRPLNEGAWAVFSRVNEQLKTASRLNDQARVQFAIRNVALIMQSLDQSIVDEADKVWVDTLVSTGALPVADAMGLVAEVARQHFATEQAATAPANGPAVRLVRR